MINKFLMSNQEFMNNYRKKHSKTPNKLRRQNQMFLINKNSETKKRSKSKKNLISPYNNKLLAPNNIYKNKKIFQRVFCFFS